MASAYFFPCDLFELGDMLYLIRPLRGLEVSNLAAT
jgi:hypothetical protein